jgi:SWI/SNF-related matrix-associated actin-dependent regulator of chromatin subfamily A-like protein 1
MHFDAGLDEGPDEGVDLGAAFWTAVREHEDPEAAEAIKASRALSADIEIPVPEGLVYLPFQKAGVLYCLKKFAQKENHPSGVLLSDEMGVRQNNSSDCSLQRFSSCS